MAIVYRIAVAGSDELKAALRSVSPKFQLRVLKGAMSRGGTLYTRELRRRSPKGPTGNLRGGIAKKVKHYKKSGTMAVIVGYRSRRAPHKHLVERGTKQRWTGEKQRFQKGATWLQSTGNPRAYRGVMPAFRMLEKTIQAQTPEYMRRLISEVRSGLEKVAKQAARQFKTVKAKVPKFLR